MLLPPNWYHNCVDNMNVVIIALLYKDDDDADNKDYPHNQMVYQR